MPSRTPASITDEHCKIELMHITKQLSSFGLARIWISAIFLLIGDVIMKMSPLQRAVLSFLALAAGGFAVYGLLTMHSHNSIAGGFLAGAVLAVGIILGWILSEIRRL